jgi:hypothetical protein
MNSFAIVFSYLLFNTASLSCSAAKESQNCYSFNQMNHYDSIALNVCSCLLCECVEANHLENWAVHFEGIEIMTVETGVAAHYNRVVSAAFDFHLVPVECSL